MSQSPQPQAEQAAADETQAVAQRYARREQHIEPGRYSILRPHVWLAVQERQRALLRLFNQLGWTSLTDKTLLEVGCGAGDNLLELIRLGFDPAQMQGAELLPDRLAQARARLPAGLALHSGDASLLPIAHNSLDVVMQATVFSSLLDDAFQQQLADAMWRWVKPGGGVLWVDFTVNNPRNADVRGVPMKRVRELFPQAEMRAWRIHLAPPLARAAAGISPHLYSLLNSLPWLRTHRLVWLGKAG